MSITDPIPDAPEGKRRRVAIVGCGRMGLVHAERLVADGRAEIVALADDNLSAAKRLRDQYAVGRPVFCDVRTMLDCVPADVVLICTPTVAHFDQVAACQSRGVHVLCEKPLSDSRARIEQLIAAAESASVQHAVAYQRRSWATYRTLRREVQSGRWGPVRAATMQVREDWQSTIGGTWRDDPRENFGGFVGDAGSHKIDAVFFVTGLAPWEAFARSWKYGSRVEVVTSVSAVLSGDVPLTMDFIGNAHGLGEDLVVSCAEADLLIRDGRAWIVRGNRHEPLAPQEAESNPVSAFLDLLDGFAENAAPFRCARPVFEFTAAILESAATGRSIGVRIGN